jgi:hypothetical protein
MTTSQTSFLSEILSDKPIPVEKLSYFRERFRNRLYNILVGKFLEKERNKQFTRADLARRIGKRPEQITRWLGSPGNWTLDTVSDLSLGMGLELEASLRSIVDHPARNYEAPEWMTVPARDLKSSTGLRIEHVCFSGPTPAVSAGTSTQMEVRQG